MKRLLTTILVILFAGSVYAVLNIGLGCLWTIGVSDNADKINQVLLNLSYSYLAGCIFYLLVTFLPERFRKRKTQSIVSNKYELIKKQVEFSVQAFCDSDITGVSLDTFTKKELCQKLKSRSIIGVSY